MPPSVSLLYSSSAAYKHDAGLRKGSACRSSCPRLQLPVKVLEAESQLWHKNKGIWNQHNDKLRKGVACRLL